MTNVSTFVSVCMVMFGLIWGIFIPWCLVLAPIGLCVMTAVTYYSEN